MRSILQNVLNKKCMVKTRGAESESEPESESPGVVATSLELESESNKLPRLRLQNVSFESVIQFAYTGENLEALFGNHVCRCRLLIM